MSHKNIPIEFLRSFKVIAELGSFTRAGERLSRTQSAISLQIKKLETLIGQPLFNRKGHNFTLTPAGDTLMRYATQILHLNDQALGELDSNAVSGKVSLGIPSEFATTLLPRVVGEFARQNPRITLEVTCDLSRNLRRDLQQKHYDLVLSIQEWEEPGHQQHFIKRDPLVWVSTPGSSLHQQNPLPMILAPEGCIYRKRALQELNTSGIPVQIVYTIMDLSGIRSAVEEGLGVTVLAKSTVPDSLEVMPLPLGSNPLGNALITLLSADEQPSEATGLLTRYLIQHLS